MIINGHTILAGERKIISISIAELYDSTEMTMDVEVVRGNEDGPRLFVSGAIHGDELNGTEIIRRLLRSDALKSLRGTLIAIPIVNSYGFNTKSRYLPDRRDLNRCFPGSENGSLTSRLANTFITEVVQHSTHGIDLHTGAVNRTNLPQVRGCLDDKTTEEMAFAFGAQVAMDEELREGSLREYCYNAKIPTILFEGGEAMRFHEKSIDAGLQGVLRVMAHLNMIDKKFTMPAIHTVRVAGGSYWVRCPKSGILVTTKKLGDKVKENELIGMMTDSFGNFNVEIYSPYDGIIIGVTTTPLLNQGDAAYHIAHEDSK